MKTTITQPYRTLLVQTPLDLPVVIRLNNPTETALALRVTDLFSFRRDGLAVTAQPIGYHGKEGIWVVAIAFRIAGGPMTPLEGVAHLNPRQAEDRFLLQRLAKQERLPFVFVSPRLKVTVQQAAPWSVHHRQEVRMLLARLDHLPIREEYGQGTDLAFEQAKAEFQRLYSVTMLLLTPSQREVQFSSPFRGVVLD
jgi:hypothetical protein